MSQPPKRILLIDDDRDDVENFGDALREINTNTELHFCGSGVDALVQLKQSEAFRPDIIFLDINMPILDGWACLREIKNLAELAEIPIVMYSTSDLNDKGLTPKDVGATAFLTKPDTFTDLKEKLGQLLSIC